MMFWMTSKTMDKYYLPNESDKDILKTQYVLVSNRLRIKDRRKWTSCMIAQHLFPSSVTLSSMDKKEIKERYLEQLDNEVRPLLAYLVKWTIENNCHIVFLCTKNEGKIHFLEYLAEYIYMEFDYPVYEYSLYSSGANKLIKYDKNKVLKHCKKILRDAERIEYENNLKTDEGRQRIIKNYKKMSKKEIKKIVKDKGFYNKNMSKKDMIELLEDFL